MDKINWLQLIIQTIIILIPLIIAGISYLSKKFNKIDKLEEEINRLDNEIQNLGRILSILLESINRRAKVLLSSHQSLITTLTKKGILTGEEMELLSKEIVEEISEKDFLQLTNLLRKHNPLSDEEISNLEKYIKKAKAKESFTTEEAADFYELAKRIREEIGFRYYDPIYYEVDDILLIAKLIKNLTDFLSTLKK